jgi:hypothetical protein
VGLLAGLESALDSLITAVDATSSAGAPLLAYGGSDYDNRGWDILASGRVVDTARQARLIQGYEDEFGIAIGIHEPWSTFTVTDVGMVLQVADVLGVDPARVASVWLIEGKADPYHAAFLHGHSWEVSGTAASKVTAAKVRAWLRSNIFYEHWGTDRFCAVDRVQGQDNQLRGPEAAHDRAFSAAWDLINTPPSAPFNTTTATAVAHWLASAGLKAKNLPRFPSGGYSGSLDVTVWVTDDAVTTDLLLQAGLYSAYERHLEANFEAEYQGQAPDIAGQPWATYIGWNSGGAGGDTGAFAGVDRQYDLHFKGKSAPQDGITAIFGSGGVLDADHVAPTELPTAADTAWQHSILLKYLYESVQVWFEEDDSGG